jgi:hypothetical protein
LVVEFEPHASLNTIIAIIAEGSRIMCVVEEFRDN